MYDGEPLHLSLTETSGSESLIYIFAKPLTNGSNFYYDITAGGPGYPIEFTSSSSDGSGSSSSSESSSGGGAALLSTRPDTETTDDSESSSGNRVSSTVGLVSIVYGVVGVSSAVLIALGIVICMVCKLIKKSKSGQRRETSQEYTHQDMDTVRGTPESHS